jgi:hypothetical protein
VGTQRVQASAPQLVRKAEQLREACFRGQPARPAAGETARAALVALLPARPRVSLLKALLRHLAQPARRTWMVLHAVWMALRMMDRSPVASGWRFCSVRTKVVSVIAVESLQVRHGNQEPRSSSGRRQASDSDSAWAIHPVMSRNLRSGHCVLATKPMAAFCSKF